LRLDGRSWRVGGLRVAAARHGHWSEVLDERRERIAAAFELLDGAYARLAPAARRSAPPRAGRRPGRTRR
jgi:hypothetical protein